MPLVSCLGVGGGFNHLCEVELPEMFAELIGGLLSGVRMRRENVGFTKNRQKPQPVFLE